MRSFFYALSFFALQTTFAQTFNGGGGVIPDDGNFADYEISVSGLPTNMDTLHFGLESVCLNLTHTWVADLAVSLIAPDGTVIPLFSNIGGDSDGFINTCLSNNATTSIFQVGYPFTGRFRPFGEMGVVNAKMLNPNGVWKLHILDTYPFADAGDLQDWSISFGDQPCKPFPFASSDLPIIKLETNGQIVPNEPKIDAYVQIIDNGPGQRNDAQSTQYAYEGRIGLELRGFSSQGFPKKSFGMELRDETGNDTAVSLLRLPKTSDYALMANFSDKTLMRNALAYEMFRQLGHYATRTRFCEVLVDGIYQGIYILTEKIKRGEDRVNIAKLSPDDTLGVDKTGGYILRIDWNTSPGWNSQFLQQNSSDAQVYFQHSYPRFEEMHPSQVEYIRSYVDSFEMALHGPGFQEPQGGWRRFADEKSFIDYLILNEMSKNVDGYRLSTYFHKDRDDKGGKLTMGPPWDYDLAWYNADYCEAFQPFGWAYAINYVCTNSGMPFWWERLAADSLFSQNLACRWSLLRDGGTLSKEHIFGVIDSMANVLAEASQRNFTYWPILGQYVWPNPGALPTTYPGEVEKLKNWLTSRLDWLDFAIEANLPQLNADFQALPLDAFTWQFSAQEGYIYAWDFGDGTVSDLRNPQHQFPGTGTYTVRLRVSTPYGCTKDTQQVFHIVNTGTSAGPDGLFKVFPNPASRFLLVQMPSGMESTLHYRLINSLGQIVGEGDLDERATLGTISVERMPRGAYTLELKGEHAPVAFRVLLDE